MCQTIVFIYTNMLRDTALTVTLSNPCCSYVQKPVLPHNGLIGDFLTACSYYTYVEDLPLILLVAWLGNAAKTSLLAQKLSKSTI